MIQISELPYTTRRRSEADLEREYEADSFAINLMIDAGMLANEVRLFAPDGFDILDDPAIKRLAKRFVVSEQLMIIRLCQLGYFEPIVKRT